MLGFIFAALLTLANALSLTTIRQGNNDFDNCGFNLSATCDDKMTLFADGNLLATSDDWKTTSVVYIKPETQVVEIHCIDGWIHGGILAASVDNGLITDGTWSCSSDNGTTWNPAYVLGTNGVTASDISPHAKWIWTGMNTWTHTRANRHTTAICKIELAIRQCPEIFPPWCLATTSTTTNTTTTTTTKTTSTETESTPSPGFDLSATCDEKLKVFADGNLLASSDNWEVTSLVNIPAHTQLIEIHCMDNGILGGILASSDSGLKTDGTWSCSSDNGTTWSPAYEMGLNGAAVPDIDTDANWIWTGCIEDWSGKYTGNKQPKNVICKTIVPTTSSTIVTSTTQNMTPIATVQGVLDGTCYSDEDHDSRLLAGYFSRSATNTPNECKDICYKEGYSYAGLQWTTECWCGNDDPPASRITDSSQCNMNCPGDASQKCGGNSRMNIYKTVAETKTAFMTSTPFTSSLPTFPFSDSPGNLNTDNYKDCPKWKHLCTSGEFGDCMNTNCAKTCKSFCSNISVKFIIRDSTTNDVIENANTILTFIEDETSSVNINTSSDGKSLIPINKTGEYKVQIAAEGFVNFETTFTIECTPSQCNLCNKTFPISLSPTIQQGEAHVFINWAENPQDLDIHVVQFNSSTTSTTSTNSSTTSTNVTCHVNFRNKNCSGFTLDVDNTNGGDKGAETVTFDVTAQNDKFVYLVYVHNYGEDNTDYDDEDVYHLENSNLRLSIVSTSGTLHEDMDSADFNDEYYWIAGCLRFDGNALEWRRKNEFVSSNPLDHSGNLCITEFQD